VTVRRSPLVLLQQLFALAFAVAVFAAYSAAGGSVDFGELSSSAWASAALSGVVYYGLAFWAFLTGLRCTPVATAAVFLSLIPLFGITAGWLLLGERMTSAQVVGAVVAMAAVLAMVRLRPAESPQIETSTRTGMVGDRL
jgi:probable blue pigment (indigoidine) exporter